ncbi:MAG TPA: MFS transporter [Isosphaeraceae bacterium]|nr:MFS transporter [Isosphaeraceae bacterium]
MDPASIEPGPGAAAEPASSPGAGAQAESRSAAGAVPRWAWGAFGLLCAMHLLDTAQRWLLTAVLPRVAQELKLTATQAEWLSTVTLLGFAAGGPPLGYLADRLRRPRLLALSFALGSLATVGSGLARSYDQLQVLRVLVGIGGAGFLCIALSILMDLFPRAIRGRVLAGFFLAVPPGAALGMILGRALGETASWQTAFLAVGAPGLLLALLALALPEPVRGSSEGVDVLRLRVHEHVGPSREDYLDLMVNSSYTYSVFGLAFASFAIAGLVYWLPTFLTSVQGLPAAQVDRALATTLLAAAVLGIAAGGGLADHFAATRPRALFLMPGLAMFGAIACVVVVIYRHGAAAIYGGTFLAVGLIALNLGPCYAILSRVVMPTMRAVACAAAVSAAHLLGDLWSPTLMGWVIDTFGQADSMATGFGRALAALGAVPVVLHGRDPENLTAGMLVVVPALVIAGAVLLAGARHLPREMALMLAKLRAAPARGGTLPPGAAPTA